MQTDASKSKFLCTNMFLNYDMLCLRKCHQYEKYYNLPISVFSLLSGSSDGSIYIHDLFNFTGSPSFTANVEHIIERNHKNAHQYSVECVQWYPQDSGLFVTGSMDKILKVWDSNRMRPVETVKFEGRIFQVHMSPIAASKCLVAGINYTYHHQSIHLMDKYYAHAFPLQLLGQRVK